MELPAFIQAWPELDVPFPSSLVKTRAIRSDAGLMVFFEILQDFDLPPHSHLGQWGTVLEGSIELTIGSETKTYGPGDSYNIPSGVEHSGKLYAGARVIDIFEEADRYPLKS